MAARFLIVPQWQGSGSSRAMRLADGAAAIRGDLPAAATLDIEVPVEAGESLGTGVDRYSALVAVRERIEVALANETGPVIVIGGDCAADLAPVQRAAAAHPGDLALVWLDAHPDLNSRETSPTGAFHGMVARALLGEAPDGLVSAGDRMIAADHLVLAGTRALDDAEAEFVSSSGIRMLGVDELADPDALVAAVAETGATTVYVHVDLDVLDPQEIGCVGYPEPFGVSVDRLTAAVKALRARFDFAGGAITEFAPASIADAEGDLPTILRILGAMTAPLA